MCLTPKPILAQGPILPTQGPLRWALPHLLLPFMVEPSPTQGGEVHRFGSNRELILKAEARFSDGGTVHFPPCVPSQKGPWMWALQACSLLSDLQLMKPNLHLSTCYRQLESSVTPPCLLPLQMIHQHILSSLPPEIHPATQLLPHAYLRWPFTCYSSLPMFCLLHSSFKNISLPSLIHSSIHATNISKHLLCAGHCFQWEFIGDKNKLEA